MEYLIIYPIASVIVALFAIDRKIGFLKALLISILLTPLAGVIFIATSPTLEEWMLAQDSFEIQRRFWKKLEGKSEE